MTRSRSLAGLICATLLGASPSLVSAQSPDEAAQSALGSWSFQSVPYRGDTCQMSGEMRIRPDPETGGLACAFTAIEACIGQDRWIVEQVCAIEQSGDRLAIQSSIVNFIEADTFTGSYLPDHFTLTIASASRMYGQIISSVSAGVEFIRREEAIS